MTTRFKEVPIGERLLTVDQAVDVAGEVARLALVDFLPRLIQALDDHWQANLRASITAALRDLDGGARNGNQRSGIPVGKDR